MNKNIPAIILCTIAAFTSLNTYAGATNSNNNTPESAANTAAGSSNSGSNNMSNNGASNFSDENSKEDHDYGWLGLIGLAGLAGLRKKSPVENRVNPNRVPNR